MVDVLNSSEVFLEWVDYVTFSLEVQKSPQNTISSNCPEHDHTNKRSNPTSQPFYTTINIMDCCVGGLLFGGLDF